MKKTEPSNLEMQILSLLWDRGPSTVRQVLQSMPDGRERAYTSILSVMQVMEKKGLLTHDRLGNAHVYRPLVDRRQTLGPMLRGMVSNIFGGRVSSVMQHLLEENEIDETELAEIRAILDRQGSATGKETQS